MDVKTLIAKLQELPQDAPVGFISDGSHGHDVDVAYLARSGYVLFAPFSEIVYNTEDRPHDAPHEVDDRYWFTSHD